MWRLCNGDETMKPKYCTAPLIEVLFENKDVLKLLGFRHVDKHMIARVEIDDQNCIKFTVKSNSDLKDDPIPLDWCE